MVPFPRIAAIQIALALLPQASATLFSGGKFGNIDPLVLPPAGTTFKGPFVPANFTPSARRRGPSTQTTNPAGGCGTFNDGYCSALASKCVDKIQSGSGTVTNLWTYDVCVAAAFCGGGVSNILYKVCCEKDSCAQPAAMVSLDYNLYATMVGSCAWAPGGCSITQQNFIDFVYGTITSAGTGQFPSSNTLVIALWNSIALWTGFSGGSIPYLNLNDWFHFFSPDNNYAVPVYLIPFDPNPYPPDGAVSQTFVYSSAAAALTTALPIPTITTTVTLSTFATVTLAPGGYIIGSLPTAVHEPGAVTPTFNSNPQPAPTASAETFTGTFTVTSAGSTSTSSYHTIIPIPLITAVVSIPVGPGIAPIVLGPGGFIVGLLPAGIAMIGDIVHPSPSPTSTSSSSTSSSSTSSGTCSTPTPTSCGVGCYDQDGDWNGPDGDLDSSDSFARRAMAREFRLEKRADDRSFSVTQCGLKVSSTVNGASAYEKLTNLDYYQFNLPLGTNFALDPTTRLQIVKGQRYAVQNYVKEHVLEFQLMGRFFNFLALSGTGIGSSTTARCSWITTNLYNPGILQSIVNQVDSIGNLVYAKESINTAKRHVNANDQNVQHANVDRSVSTSDQAVKDKAQNAFTAMARAFGGYVSYMNAAIPAQNFKQTAQGIIDILEDGHEHDIAEQFYDWLDTEIDQWQGRANTLGTGIITYAESKITCPITRALLDQYGMSYATLPNINKAALMPNQPDGQCFVDGSQGFLQISGINSDAANTPYQFTLWGSGLWTNTLTNTQTSPIFGLKEDFYNGYWALVSRGGNTYDTRFNTPTASPMLSVDCRTNLVTMWVNNAEMQCGLFSGTGANGIVGSSIACAANIATAYAQLDKEGGWGYGSGVSQLKWIPV